MAKVIDAPDIFCSQFSQAAGIPLHGSATQAEIWILLEHSEKWPAQWLQGNTLPANIQSWTHSLEKQLPKSKVAFIKRQNTNASRSLYLAVTDPSEPRLYRFEWNDYPDLLKLNLLDALNGNCSRVLVNNSLICVCTHGLRDRCCAKFGLPVYTAMSDDPDLEAWEITHLGGHRFAATAAIFPSGIMYGYLTPEHAPILSETIRHNSIHLPNYRGRTFYDGPTNAADYFLRNKTKVTGDRVFQLLDSKPTDYGHVVTFSDKNTAHRIYLAVNPTLDFASCGKPQKPGVKYDLVQYETCELR